MKSHSIAAAIAFALAAPALAQSPEPRHEFHWRFNGQDLLADAAEARATAESWRHWGEDLRASLGTMFGERLSATKPVKDAPYSADVNTESNRTLADGNAITRKTSGRVFRDGEGRTRQETVVNGQARSIQLRDPVAGTSVMLLPGSKKAVRTPLVRVETDTRKSAVLRLGDREFRIDDGKVSVDGKEVSGKVEVRAGGKEIRIENGRITIDGKEFVPGEGGRKVFVKRLDETETGDGTKREEVRVHVIRGGDGKEVDVAVSSLPMLAQLPPLLGAEGGRLDGALPKAKGTTTSLGVKEFEGVRAEGTSTVRTIPAGEIGNRNPILITSESWYSPELQVTVYSRQNDPRHGETIYRLSNIRRAEPAAELFKVPAEYSGTKRSRG